MGDLEGFALLLALIGAVGVVLTRRWRTNRIVKIGYMSYTKSEDPFYFYFYCVLYEILSVSAIIFGVGVVIW